MIGHRADGRRVKIGSVIPGAAVWFVLDYPPLEESLYLLKDMPPIGHNLRVREVALHVQRIWYPDDWQGPLESDWEFLDDDWRVARARYRSSLEFDRIPGWEIERRVQLRFPDDAEVARLDIVAALIIALHVLGGAARTNQQSSRRQPGTRPEGRVETCYAEDGAPRFPSWAR